MSRAPRNDAASFRLRAGFAFVLLLLAAGGLVARAIDLQLLDKEFLIGQGDARYTRAVKTLANRGAIVDRNGSPLAISTPVESVYADPRELAAVPDHWPALAKQLGLKRHEFEQRVSSSQKRNFIWLSRHLPPNAAQAVRKLAVPGVYFRQEYRRYYPQAEVAGHVLGFTDVDDVGQEGVEIVFDQSLRGESGLKRVIQDRMGRKVEDVENIRTARPGRDLALSLDMRIQYLAYRELKGAIAANRARSGSMVVIDVTTGEILAMVNQPAFNPNDRNQRASPAMHRNRAATDLLEPGSSIKPFVVAAALESGRFDAGSVIDTSPGFIRVGNAIFDDEHPQGALSLAGVLAKSSNVGMIKIAQALKKEQIWTTLTQLGFGRVTDSRFPGESAGVLSNYASWRPVGVATLSFGYGLSVTPLQLAQAYATIGALGVARPVSLLRVDQDVPGERVLAERNARTLISLLESVISDGTGSKAAIPGYRVAGKTGTARKNGSGGYAEDRHVGVFGGVAPASRPRLAAVVVIDEPAAGRYYGGDIAAPVFSTVVGGALRLMGVAPDATSDLNRDPLTGVATMVSR